MDLELKAIKYAEFASEETHCYEGKVYLDGKPFAYVSNDGHGGADRVDFHEKSAFVYQIKDDGFPYDISLWREKLKEVEAYFESLPNTPSEYFDDGLPQSLEGWCGDQVTGYMIRKDLKRLLAKQCLFFKDDGIYNLSYKGSKKPDMGLFIHVEKTYPEATILNTISDEEAFELYKAHS